MLSVSLATELDSKIAKSKRNLIDNERVHNHHISVNWAGKVLGGIVQVRRASADNILASRLTRALLGDTAQKIGFFAMPPAIQIYGSQRVLPDSRTADESHIFQTIGIDHRLERIFCVLWGRDANADEEPPSRCHV
jgi:hypothetical protein